MANMKKLLIFAIILLAAGCTPADDLYCKRFNLPPAGVEYANCKAYYARMDQWFSGDLTTCHSQAQLAYPEYLYDHARYGQIQTFDRYGYVRNSNIVIEPDYYRNQSLDMQRRQIVAPCMAKAGWNSPDTWQAGRRDAKAPAFVP